jgi:hypothetical protein
VPHFHGGFFDAEVLDNEVLANPMCSSDVLLSQRGEAATKGTGSNQQSNCHKKHKKSLLTYGNLPGAYKRREPVSGKI